jgi:hypothetical protein
VTFPIEANSYSANGLIPTDLRRGLVMPHCEGTKRLNAPPTTNLFAVE